MDPSRASCPEPSSRARRLWSCGPCYSVRAMQRPACLLVVSLLLVALAACGGGGSDCTVGSLGCACTTGGGCDPGLACDPADQRCEAAGGCACDVSSECE